MAVVCVCVYEAHSILGIVLLNAVVFNGKNGCVHTLRDAQDNVTTENICIYVEECICALKENDNNVKPMEDIEIINFFYIFFLYRRFVAMFQMMHNNHNNNTSTNNNEEKQYLALHQ